MYRQVLHDVLCYSLRPNWSPSNTTRTGSEISSNTEIWEREAVHPERGLDTPCESYVSWLSAAHSKYRSDNVQILELGNLPKFEGLEKVLKSYYILFNCYWPSWSLAPLVRSPQKQPCNSHPNFHPENAFPMTTRLPCFLIKSPPSTMTSGFKWSFALLEKKSNHGYSRISSRIRPRACTNKGIIEIQNYRLQFHHGYLLVTVASKLRASSRG